jgi:Icc-related predicted phosphoesterase
VNLYGSIVVASTLDPQKIEIHARIFRKTMKLLLTADLHFRVHWFRWLIEQARDFDFVCIAGDLLDMFKFESRTAQTREVRNLLRELADVVPVAICSGNHDNAGRQISPDRAPVYEWFVELSSHPNIITDGSTQKVGNLIVTTIPYHCSKEQKSVWLDRGFTIRRQTGNTWLVLHHVPPKSGLDAGGEEREAAELLVSYHPDYFVSGHDHAFPYKFGWNCTLSGVRLLVPGQLLRASIPNYILLNPEQGEASWHTSSERWIPEDGLFDHLVLKLPKV